jgi:hypothetical protein
VFLADHVVSRRRIGRPPALSDAELLCLAIAQVLLGFPSERHWIRYARAHLRQVFPCGTCFPASRTSLATASGSAPPGR